MMHRILRRARPLAFAIVIAAYACILPAYRQADRAEPVMTNSIEYQAMTRDETRMFSVDVLRGIILSETAADEQRQSAQAQLDLLLAHARQEAEIEAELLARGFGRAVASVSENFVSVFMEAAPGDAACAQIYEAAARITGCETGNIRLIPLNAP